MKIEFNQLGTFAATYAAEAWCREHSISVGASEQGKPRGLLRGDWVVSKWHNMTQQERAALDGRMTGDMRDGPVFIEIRDRKCT